MSRTEASRFITERCLIAADIDRTVLSHRGDREREEFLESVAPQLLRAAALGLNLAFLTGNSMEELTSRFLDWFIAELCHTDRLDLLDRFHFFCNSGGAYAHFSVQDEALNRLLNQASFAGLTKERVLRVLTTFDSRRKPIAIHPRFMDSSYIERCTIPSHDQEVIMAILQHEANEYVARLSSNRTKYERTYDVAQVCNEKNEILTPSPAPRTVTHGPGRARKTSTVQVSIKPILSFRHAHTPRRKFNSDLRGRLTETVQSRLDRHGLERYVARPGGRSTIDVTLDKVDKAYALEFLIDRLNLQGPVHSGKKFGSNTIYLGDEVIVGGGNDYAVTRIPGLLVFAVNSDKDVIPFLSHVFVPSDILEGPEATADVLSRFNASAQVSINAFHHPSAASRGNDRQIRTALEVFKEDLFATRINEKIDGSRHGHHHSVDDWQTLHAFVTLMCRQDPTARDWLRILVSELDAIMAQLAVGSVGPQPALGTSHADW